MARALVHRGPDAEGFHWADGVGFAFRRLAIIDRAGGDQPIANEDGRVVVVFNGEIYNHHDLRSELERCGHRFGTRADTEVLVHGYEEWGIRGLLARLVGMFAFALHDRRRRRVVLARDRLGIKPLHLERSGDTLWFASEPKALFAGRPARRAIDPRSLLDYLVLGYVPGPRTIHVDVERLEPGCFAVVEEGRIVRERYWTPPFDRLSLPLDEAAARVRALLSRAVADRLEAEVPLGCFLSGGVDSSAVAAAMVAARGGEVDTVTVGFEERDADERRFAAEVARHLGVRAHVEVVRPDPARIDRVLEQHDEPHGDPSDVPTDLLCAAARRHVVVALSGDGGDELFAGYRRYAFDRLEHRVRSVLPAWLRRAVLLPAADALPKGDRLPRPLRAKTFLGNVARDPIEAYLRSVSRTTPEDAERLLAPHVLETIGEARTIDRFREIGEKEGLDDPVLRARAIDLATWLPDDILAKVDRASMAHSLEVRVPLLDHRLVEFAVGLDPALLVRGTQGKRVWKRAVEGLLPRSVLERTKHGFDLPVRRWLAGPLAGEVESLGRPGSASARWLDGPAVRRVVEGHLAGLRDRTATLWQLVLLERFLRRREEGE